MKCYKTLAEIYVAIGDEMTDTLLEFKEYNVKAVIDWFNSPVLYLDYVNRKKAKRPIDLCDSKDREENLERLRKAFGSGIFML